MTKAATSKTWVRSIFAGTGKRWSDPDAPLSATVNTFRALPNPVVDGSEWSTGENKGVRDNVTGDLVLIRWTQTNNAFVLYSSQDNGITWARLATDVSNPDPGATYQYANCLFGLAQDSSGAVHGITCGKQGDQRYFYIRFALTRSGGHVTGFSIAQNVIPLAFHARTGVDIRGNIYVIKQDGAERLLFTYGINIAANALDVNIFAVRSTTITPTLAAHFVGLDGTGSDTLVYTKSNSQYQMNHGSEGMFAQNEASEDLYMFFGQINADMAIGGGGTDPTAFNIFAVRCVKGTGGWTIGTTTQIVNYSANTIPMILDCDSAADKAWVMYIHGVTGIQFAYFDASGTLVNSPVPSPLVTTNKAAFGTFTVSDDGRIWTVFNTYGFYAGTSTPVAGKLGYWNGVSWSLQDDTTAQNSVTIAGLANWDNGCCAIRLNGDPVAQTTDGTVSVATVYGP